MAQGIKTFLFVICIVMVFTAQTNRPDDKGQQHAPAARPAASRPASVAHNSQARPQVQTRREAPAPQVSRRASVTVQTHISQPSRQQWQGPRVQAVLPPAPVQNNRFLNRQHHKNWQPRYNFYDSEYHFYPYVNIASIVELSGTGVLVQFNGQNYYFDQGTFYLQDQTGAYTAVPPPIGISVNALAVNARQIEVDGQIYYRCRGVFYIQAAQGYQVVGPVQPVPADT